MQKLAKAKARKARLSNIKDKLGSAKDKVADKLSREHKYVSVFEQRERAGEKAKSYRNALAVWSAMWVGGQFGFASNIGVTSLGRVAPEVMANGGEFISMLPNLALAGATVGALAYGVSALRLRRQTRLKEEREACIHQVYEERAGEEYIAKLMEREGVTREEAARRLNVEPAEKLTLRDHLFDRAHVKTLKSLRVKHASTPLHRLQQLSLEQERLSRHAPKQVGPTPEVQAAKKAGLGLVGVGSACLASNILWSTFSPADIVSQIPTFLTSCNTLVASAAVGALAMAGMYTAANHYEKVANNEESRLTRVADKLSSAYTAAKDKVSSGVDKIQEIIHPSDVTEIIRADLDRASGSAIETNATQTQDFEMSRE